MTEHKKPTPEQRALELYSYLQTHHPKPTMWDLVCFCTETLAVLSSELTFLRPAVTKLVSIVYTAHNHSDQEWPSCLSSQSTGVSEQKQDSPKSLMTERNDGEKFSQ